MNHIQNNLNYKTKTTQNVKKWLKIIHSTIETKKHWNKKNEKS